MNKSVKNRDLKYSLSDMFIVFTIAVFAIFTECYYTYCFK